MQKKAALFNLFACLLIILNTSETLKAQKIITIAGNSNGNGAGYPRSRNSSDPSYGVATDEYGNVFFSEIDKSTVTRIDPDGIVTLVAGDISEFGFSGDGGLATNAKLDGPQGIFVDKKGNIYIADTYNNRIRKVNQDGIIKTVAGNGNAGYSGDGGSATNASLTYPADVMVDSVGNIFISDNGNNRIRKVDKNGIITTVAGNGTAGFSGDNGKAINASLNQPTGICLDKNGNLIIADTHNHRIRKVDQNNIITTIGGNGSSGNFCSSSLNNDTTHATNFKIGEPTDVDIDSLGNIFLIASYNCSVEYIDATGILHFVTSSDEPERFAYSKINNSLYFSIVDEDVCWGHNPNIVHFDLGNLKSQELLLGGGKSVIDKGENIPATVAELNYPKGLAIINNELYVVDEGFYRIRKIDANGYIATIAGIGIKETNGYGDGGPAINAGFSGPACIIADKKNNIFISDKADGRIRKINAKGIITTAYQIASPEGMAFDKQGNLYVTSTLTSASKVYKIDSAGTITTVAGINSTGYNGDHIPATSASLAYPAGVYVDDDNTIYIADYGNNRIRKVDTAGIITTVAGTNESGYSGDGGLAKDALLYNPTSIIKDKSGNFYISDNSNDVVRKIDKRGIITTVVGSGIGDSYNCDGDWYDIGAYSGDDDTATWANLYGPYNTIFDKNGNMYISDEGNYRIREVIYNCKPKPAPASTAMQQYINRQFTLQQGCNLLLVITPRLTYLSSLNSNLVANVWVEKRVVRDSVGKLYVQRHFQILSSINPFSSTAMLTFYINQSDFDSYNNAVGTKYAKLPTSPDDSAGIANLMLYSYRSKSKDSSGLPGSYTAKPLKINPLDKNIVWNTEDNYWEVSANVAALGGFFIGTERNAIASKNSQSIQIKDEPINIYPNPATDKIYVSLPETLLYKPVQLFNGDGKLITQQTAASENMIFNVGELSAGIYLIRFADGEVKKVIVSKK